MYFIASATIVWACLLYLSFSVTGKILWLHISAIYEKAELVAQLNSEFERVAPISMFYGEVSSPSLAAEISQRIRAFYFKEQPIGNETLHHVVDVSLW